MSLLFGTMGLLIAAALAGDAAARDVQTRMDPLLYTAPVSKLALPRRPISRGFRPLRGASCLAVPLGCCSPHSSEGVRAPWSIPSGCLSRRVLVPAAAERLRRDRTACSRWRRSAGAPRGYLGGVLLVAACAFSWTSWQRHGGSGSWRSCWIPSAPTVLRRAVDDMDARRKKHASDRASGLASLRTASCGSALRSACSRSRTSDFVSRTIPRAPHGDVARAGGTIPKARLGDPTVTARATGPAHIRVHDARAPDARRGAGNLSTRS